MTVSNRYSHSSHWGAFEAEIAGGEVRAVHHVATDSDPSPLLGNVPGTLRHPTRIGQPAIRAGWLDDGPGSDPRRGSERFVSMSWETAIECLAGELRRVYTDFGANAVYGGSYGWASAGRFHHAQSQLHRFLNCLGGFVRSEHTYSNGALTVLMPHVVGSSRDFLDRATDWAILAESTELFVCFAGIPLKNTTVTPGGAGRHPAREYLRAAADRGAEFVLVSPLRDDLPEFVNAQWLPIVPGTDVAMMLALAHVLIEEGLHDRDFLERCCAGYLRFERYVRGADDGLAKTPEWAAGLCGIPAEAMRDLARRMAKARTFINVNYSLQRIEHGEQVPWMAVTLAAILGQIGLPGGGFGQGYGSLGYVGRPRLRIGPPALPQGDNPVASHIPVARVADMLLHPGESYDFDGQRLEYPDVRLVYWCGGNPFHHHQDLARLRRAFARPDTIVVHESYWTATARHADIVLPATVTLERNDIGASPNDDCVIAMRAAAARYAQARDDFEIFSDLASALQVRERFTEGRDETSWLRHLYDGWHAMLCERNAALLPPFDEFWKEGFVVLDDLQHGHVLYADFRADPATHPLDTPSGRIEIFSETIAGFGYADCPGHPAWLEPREWLGATLADRFPLHLVANNPKTRLHAQLDMGSYSQSEKVQGREPIRMNPEDAASRGIRDGDVVRVFNSRGACLAGAVLDDAVRRRVVQLSTGAWYDPIDPKEATSMCVSGNPNVLTADRGTSQLGQGCTGQHALVEVARWTDPIPPIRAFDPPRMEIRRILGTSPTGSKRRGIPRLPG